MVEHGKKGNQSSLSDLVERLEELKASEDEQIFWLCQDHTKAKLARIIVAGRISHAERDIKEAEALSSPIVMEEGWRPIDQHTPIKCLIYGPVWGVSEGLRQDNGKWIAAAFNGQVLFCEPTHWHPLPAAPSKSEDAQPLPGQGDEACDCFGDTGLQASTYCDANDKRRCDLCGKLAQPLPPSAEMVEAVARAIVLAEGGDPDEPVRAGGFEWPAWHEAIVAAKAAIAALSKYEGGGR